MKPQTNAGGTPGARLNQADMKLWHLKQCPLFVNLSQAELGALFDVTRLIVLDPGECIPDIAAEEPSVWVIKRGYVKMSCIDEDGRDSAIMVLSPGDLFGAILPPHESPAMGEFYRALSGVCLVRLGRSAFERLMQNFPGLAYRIHKAYAQRIYRLQMRVSDLLMRSVEERLALTLLELDREVGKAMAGGARVLGLPLSHRDLAQLIGSSREMVTHVMARYREEGLIGATRRREITLLDVEGLRRICCAEARSRAA